MAACSGCAAGPSGATDPSVRPPYGPRPRERARPSHASHAERASPRTASGLAQIPKEMQYAIISQENKTFYTDSGIDPKGI
ncbi:transglycosylase domain-containing protein, partial [Streptomyces olivaceus]